MTEKIKVACYCRVSTKKAEQEMSLENQQKFFEDFTVQNNMDIYNLYKDDGISAKSMKKRDDFNRMVSDAKKGLFTKILVKDVSRFARNTYDFLSVIRELKANKIEVQFITANMTTYDSELMLTILAAVAQEESANLSKRVKFAKEQSSKEGRVPGMVYGYDKIPKDRYGLKINEAEAKVVRRVFDLYINEQMSTYQIAALFNQEMVPTKKGGKYQWSQTVICSILKNRLYIGQVCNNKSELKDFISGERVKYAESEWIVVDRPEYRIISDEVFKQANAIRETRSNAYHQFEDDGKIKTKRVSVKYPLSNLLVCANDNYAFRRRTREYAPSGYSYTYWTCSKRDYGVSTCDNKLKIDEKQMQRAIVEFLLKLFENRDIIRSQFKSSISKELKQRYESEYKIDNLLDEQKKLEVNKSKLMDLYLMDGIDKESVRDKLIPIDNRLGQIRLAIKIFHEQDTVAVNIEKCLEKLMNRIDDHLGDMLDNGFLKSIFEKFLVYPDGKVSAVIRIDYDTGKVIEMPFGEFVDEKKVSVPKQTNDIQQSDGIEPAYRQLAGENRHQCPGEMQA
jgi:DNA invertase Pin-like site-specific DNA recombinase